MIEIMYDNTSIRFIGIKNVEVKKYSNGKIFINVHTNYANNDTCVILCCKEYEIVYVTKGVVVKEYLNGME